MVQNVATGEPMNGPDDSDFHMPPNVYAFVKCYANAAKREFYVFMGAADLMAKGGLEIKCPVKASKLAQSLQYLYDDFNIALSKLAARCNYRKRGAVTRNDVADEAIMRLLRASFFKVIKKDAGFGTKHDTGWFSGHPIDWKAAIANAQPEPPMWLSGSAIAAAFANLTGHIPAAIDGFLPKPVSFDEYEEEDEDEEDDDQWTNDWTGE